MSFSEAYSLPELDQETATIDRRWQGDTWDAIDSWVSELTETYPVTVHDDKTITLFENPNGSCWCELDSWWTTYNEVSTENARVLKTVLEQSNDMWVASLFRFDTDPLATDWAAHPSIRGLL